MAEALALPYETDKADNINKEATVKIKYMDDVNNMDDVNSDGVVDMRDIQIIVIAFGSFIDPKMEFRSRLNL